MPFKAALLREKRKAGEPLTVEERAFLRAYESKHDGGRVSIWVPPELLDEWKGEASEKGMRLSPWLRAKVQEARVGDAPALLEARRVRDVAVHDKEAAQAAFGDLANQLREKDYQIRRLEEQAQTLHDLLRRLEAKLA